jgi:hypothetical protein
MKDVTHDPWQRGSIPNRVVYVLHGGPRPVLNRVTSQVELEREFGERVTDADVADLPETTPSGRGAWDAMRQSLRGLIPWR